MKSTTTTMRLAAFRPHPLVRGGHLQTIAGQLWTGAPAPGPHRVSTVTLRDGDRLLLHVDEPTRAADPKLPVAVLLHGLGGDSESTYILRIGAKLNAAGHTVVRFNHRGCGRGSEGLARQIYHAGRIDDLGDALTHLETLFPGRPVVVAAFSLSANMLLRFLGETPVATRHPGLLRTMAVCPPVDLELCSRALAAKTNWAIDRYYTRRLLATAAARAALFADETPTSFPRKMNLRLFDEVYTAPRAGFRDRDEYYTVSSSRRVTAAIRTETLVLAAADDPIIPESSFAGVRFGDAVRVVMERTGGHMGFLAATPTRYGDRRWMDVAVVDWLTAGAAALS